MFRSCTYLKIITENELQRTPQQFLALGLRTLFEMKALNFVLGGKMHNQHSANRSLGCFDATLPLPHPPLSI